MTRERAPVLYNVEERGVRIFPLFFGLMTSHPNHGCGVEPLYRVGELGKKTLVPRLNCLSNNSLP